MIKSSREHVKRFFQNSLPVEYSGLQIQKEDSRFWYFLCPFHEDHHPSLTVNKSGRWFGYFRCWSCGKNGSPRRFAKLMGKLPSQRRYLPKKSIHRAGDTSKPKRDFAALAKAYQAALTDERWQRLSVGLGIERSFLDRLGLGYGRAWHRSKHAVMDALSFPMFDEHVHVVGIRFRFADGEKTSAKGCRTGLFLDRRGYESNRIVLLTEGVTDTATALALGFQAIGRPNATAYVSLVCHYIIQNSFTKIVIIADNDSPGMKGAYQLADRLTAKGISVKVIQPPKPHKDLRDWYLHGAQIEDVWQRIEQTSLYAPVEVEFLKISKRTSRKQLRTGKRL